MVVLGAATHSTRRDLRGGTEPLRGLIALGTAIRGIMDRLRLRRRSPGLHRLRSVPGSAARQLARAHRNDRWAAA
jgi:hypothetical protein